MTIASFMLDRLAVRYVVLGDLVFRLRRVTSETLAAAGYEDLVGSASAAEALRLVKLDQAVERRRDPAKAAAWRDNQEQREQAKRRQTYDEQLSTPEGVADWLRKCEAYMVAAVDGAGRLRADAPPLEERPKIGRFAVLPSSATIDLYADGIAPFAFVADVADEDPEADRLWVGRFDPLQRQSLGLAAMALQDVSQEVAPFRRRAGAADDPASTG